MGEILKINNSTNLELLDKKGEIIKVAEDMLLDARKHIDSNNAISVPIMELATLGAGVSSLIPSLRTITQTTAIDTQGLGLYQLANASVGDTLKVAKNGNFWGAFKTSSGKSKFVQLKNADLLSATTTAVMPINPAIVMMAVALFTIEKKLNEIAKMEKQILEFLEREKKAEIEADIETLVNIINKYKLNWDNEHFITNNHKMVLDIQRTARKNINFYQKEVKDLISSNQLISFQSQVSAKVNKLLNKFNYYKLSLYAYSLASLLEIMLSGNFKEYISGIKNELMTLSNTYEKIFEKASSCIEKMSSSSVETNFLKGIGFAAKGVGDFIGSIPFVKDGPVDEFLQDGGDAIEENAKEIEKAAIKKFKTIRNPGINDITKQMKDITLIYNHTSQIYFDDKMIYLIRS